jgi:ribosome-associated toxin RatA of RatAB toxin-antitoxin module
VKRVSRSAIVEHSAEALYALIEDIESYPAFLPWCRGASVQTRTGERTVATLSVGLRGIKQSFTTENRNTPGRAIQMQLVEGPFKHFSAHWRLTPLGAHAARVEFTMAYAFSSRVMAKLLEPLFGQIADTMVDAFVRRADALYARPAN